MPLPIRPRKRSAVWVGWITGGEYDGSRVSRFTLMGTQPINRTGQSELGRTQTIHEVSTSTLTRLLE
jgi:hypothetical protein